MLNVSLVNAIYSKINYVCVILFMLILNLFKYAYFKLLIINKKNSKIETKNTVADVVIEHAMLASESNAQPFSQLAVQYLVVHNAIAV